MFDCTILAGDALRLIVDHFMPTSRSYWKSPRCCEGCSCTRGGWPIDILSRMSSSDPGVKFRGQWCDTTFLHCWCFPVSARAGYFMCLPGNPLTGLTAVMCSRAASTDVCSRLSTRAATGMLQLGELRDFFFHCGRCDCGTLQTGEGLVNCDVGFIAIFFLKLQRNCSPVHVYWTEANSTDKEEITQKWDAGLPFPGYPRWLGR